MAGQGLHGWASGAARAGTTPQGAMAQAARAIAADPQGCSLNVAGKCGRIISPGDPWVGGPGMPGESAHFGLRERPPTPAVRSFDLPPRMTPMLDRAKTGLAE